MPRVNVYVELVFEDIEAPTADYACSLGEIWCGAVWKGPAAKADAIGSCATRRVDANPQQSCAHELEHGRQGFVRCRKCGRVGHVVDGLVDWNTEK